MNTLLFFFNDTATTEIYTLSLHDALPISSQASASVLTPSCFNSSAACSQRSFLRAQRDRKSTRLNSSHGYISYAVFCLNNKYLPQSAEHSPTRTERADLDVYVPGPRFGPD